MTAAIVNVVLALIGAVLIIMGISSNVSVPPPPQSHQMYRANRYDAGKVTSFPMYETHINRPFQHFLQRPYNGMFAGSLPTVPIDQQGDFINVGFVYSKDNHRLPLYGRPTYPGGNRFQYYVIDDSINANPIEIYDHNGLELETDNIVAVPGYQDDFLVYTH